MAKNPWSLILFWVTVAFSVFQLTVPVFTDLIDLQVKSIHIIFGASIALLANSLRKSAQDGARPPVRDLIFIGILIAANVNVYLDYLKIYNIPGSAETKDFVLGVLIILTLLEAGRRTTGWIMPGIVIGMFVYVFVGHLIPGGWGHPSFSPWFVLNSVYYSERGIYGAITGFSATFIATFIIFGALLMRAGVGRTFMDIALLLAGKFRGGPAKVAVVSSALFGTMSGSAVANVAITGTYTIPLMKRLGYRPDFAGGVEAMASTGGMITPPIMGINAFIMSELLGIPYTSIIWYALIPCLLYYTGLFAGVHFEALRLELVPVPKEELPRWKSITWAKLAPLVIPITLMIWLILQGYDLTTVGFFASMATLVIYIFFSPNFSPSGLKERLIESVKALSDGGKQLAFIVPVMVIVSILVNLLGITGVAPKISGLILDIGGNQKVGALLVAGIVPLLLGAVLPPPATYLITAALVAPALTGLGIDLVAAHMFLLYWAALGAVTPPTCIPAVVAANIAGASWTKVALVAMKLGVVAFLMPFFFVINPALLARGTPFNILIYAISALAGAVLIASGLFGYLLGKTKIVFRLLYGASGLLLLYPSYYLSVFGIAIAVFTFIVERLFAKRKKAVVTPELK